MDDVTEDNVLPMLQLSVSLAEMTSLTEHCLQYIRLNAGSLLHSSDLFDLNDVTMALVVGSDMLCCDGEGDIYNACIRWASDKVTKKGLALSDDIIRKELGSILYHIRLPSLSVEDLELVLGTSCVVIEEERQALVRYVSLGEGQSDLTFPTVPRVYACQEVMTFLHPYNRVHLQQKCQREDGRMCLSSMFVEPHQDVWLCAVFLQGSLIKLDPGSLNIKCPDGSVQTTVIKRQEKVNTESTGFEILIKPFLLKAGERYLVTSKLAMMTLEDILAILSRQKCGVIHSTIEQHSRDTVFTFGDFLHVHTLKDDLTIHQYTGGIHAFTIHGQQIIGFKYYSMLEERELVNKYNTDERPNEVSNNSEAIRFSAYLRSNSQTIKLILVLEAIFFVVQTLLNLVYAFVFEKTCD